MHKRDLILGPRKCYLLIECAFQNSDFYNSGDFFSYSCLIVDDYSNWIDLNLNSTDSSKHFFLYKNSFEKNKRKMSQNIVEFCNISGDNVIRSGDFLKC